MWGTIGSVHKARWIHWGPDNFMTVPNIKQTGETEFRDRDSDRKIPHISDMTDISVMAALEPVLNKAQDVTGPIVI